MGFIDDILKNKKQTISSDMGQQAGIRPTILNEVFHEKKEEIKEVVQDNLPSSLNPEPKKEVLEIVKEPIKEASTEDERPELTDYEKECNQAYTEFYMSAISVTGAMGLQWVSGDWTDAGHDKYNLPEKSQIKIATAWAKMLNMKRKAKSPESSFFMLILGAYLPLVLSAARIGLVKKKERKNKVKEKKKPIPKKNVIEPEKEIVLIPVRNQNLVDSISQKELDNLKHQPKKQQGSSLDFLMSSSAATEIKKPIDESIEFKRIEGREILEVYVPKKEAPKEAETPTQKIVKQRGRKSGSKRNPDSGQFEMYKRIEGDYFIFSWGERAKMSAKAKEALKGGGNV